MKLRYYMRGLGIGIVVTAFIMMIALGGKKESMTDEEIKTRAKQLGMVENTVLASLNDKKQQEETTPPETKQTEVLPEETQPIETQPEETKPEETQPEETQQDVAEPEIGEMITIVIKSGASSNSVSKLLEEEGLVENARAYDAYLCQNGYDKKISVGTYKIPMGCTDEEIAKVITKKLSFE